MIGIEINSKKGTTMRILADINRFSTNIFTFHVIMTESLPSAPHSKNKFV